MANDLIVGHCSGGEDHILLVEDFFDCSSLEVFDVFLKELSSLPKNPALVPVLLSREVFEDLLKFFLRLSNDLSRVSFQQKCVKRSLLD